MSSIRFHDPHPAGLPISTSAAAGDFFFTMGDGEAFNLKTPRPGMRKLFRRLKTMLAREGLTFRDVVKVTALLTHAEEVWKDYTAVYCEYFKAPYPCRTTIPIPWKTDFLEIDLIAYKKGMGERKPKNP